MRTPTPRLNTNGRNSKYTSIVPIGDEPEGFREFRGIYPRRNVAFPTTLARKRWREALRRGVRPEEIIAGAKAYAAEQDRIGKVGTEYVKTADAWLNQQRWQDYALGPDEPAAPPAASISDETWRDRVRRWKATGGHWPWKSSDTPDSPQTGVPRHVLKECGVDREVDQPVLRIASAG